MSVLATLKKTAGSVAKFMARYADEASDLADVLRSILTAVPLQYQERDKVLAIVEKFDGIADNIGKFLAENPTIGEPVKIRASDLDAALKRYFEANPEVISAAVSAAISKDANTPGDESGENA
jgi:ABC-type transporter Mla subunit MlaD